MRNFKARQIIFYFFILALSAILLLSWFFRVQNNKNTRNLLAEGERNLENFTNKIYFQQYKIIERFLFDNSYWYDFFLAVDKKDTSWIAKHMIPNAVDFNYNTIWVLDKKGVPLFYYDDEQLKSIVNFEDKAIQDSLIAEPNRLFHVNGTNTISMILTAPVRADSGNRKFTKPIGYFILGRKLDTKYISQLNDKPASIQFYITDIHGKGVTDTMQNNHTAIVNKPLKDIFGKTIANFSAIEKFNAIKLFNAEFDLYQIFYLFFTSFILFLLFLLVRKRILNPLNKLSKTLSTNQLSHLEQVMKKEDEFKEVGTLIHENFAASKILTDEILMRKSTEAALKISMQEVEALTIAKVKTEQKNIAKSEFLSTMSHEIRTPINGVIGIANLLKDEPLTAYQQQLVNTLLFSSNYLTAVLSDILDFSKIESGNIQFDKNSFYLPSILDNIYQLYAPKAKEKNIDFAVMGANNQYLWGDSVRLSQILSNLISNAIKFTHKGSVVVNYWVVTETPQSQTISFSVTDTGIGIEATKQESIFESFTQADASTNSNFGGTGLGLTISKKLIALQGGAIELKSTINEGSCFTFTLSFEKNDKIILPETTEAHLLANIKEPLSGMHILVAEDNHINATILKKFLEKWKATCVIVANGKEAIVQLTQASFDLILMDLHMPEMNGKEAVEKIRLLKDTSFANIPIIALTADATTDTRLQILKEGFNDYATKPFDPKGLLELLLKYKKG
jgi:signal transduction histidine kinase/CheY-like chemotaxis protein